ncbi:MAG: non-heme iron oxygenase ferredoxin subunit [Candidatus Aenigmarchaeota archaeon]|nr:non-heme iron oxygenase ferredoxin subunit [Candidatus Aenigmarchaeota archaeon]
MTNSIELCNVKDVKEGEMKPFDIEGKQIMIVNRSGKFFAVDRICTHAEADLSDGFLNEDSVVCPLHLSAFNLSDGHPTNPPATRPIRTYKIKIENNKISVEV